jgi:hypothetical protein
LFDENDAGSETINILRKNAFEVDDMFVNVLHYDQEIDSYFFEYFGEYLRPHKTITHFGLCLSFNMLSAENILNENVVNKDFVVNEGFNKTIDWDPADLMIKNIYPWRMMKSQFFNMNFILAIANAEFANACIMLKNSYRISFHLPNEIPTIFSEHIFTSAGDTHER